MKRLLVYFVLVAAVFTSCTTLKYVPVETVKEVHIRDSVYLRDTIVRVELEKARLSDFVDVGDTLVLTTDLARSTAFVDSTSGKLKGTLENIKKYAEKPVQVKEKIVYRDSVVTKEVPVEVQVEKIVKRTPWIMKVLSGIGIVALGLFAGWMIGKYLHLK
jgi:hypothetical protein